MSDSNAFKIALLGQPNSGKSTVFNILTGSHQHVGNWPGKTVEKKEGTFSHNGRVYMIADLPGSYSLCANSDEEIVTRNYIASGNADLVMILADASQLERSLYMLADYVGINTPAMLVVTMNDVAKDQGKEIDLKQLEANVGIPVAGIVSPDIKTYDELFDKLERSISALKKIDASALYKIFEEGELAGLYKEALEIAGRGKGGFSPEWIASKLMEQDSHVAELVKDYSKNEDVDEFVKRCSDGALYSSNCRFDWVSEILKGVYIQRKDGAAVLSSFDKKVLKPGWGKLISVGLTLVTFLGAFVIAAPIMAVSSVFPKIFAALGNVLMDAGVAKMLVDYVVSVLGNTFYWTFSMLGFVLGINFAFGILEDSGFMARVSYVFDGSMSKIGLQGKSIMPMLVGLGCTIGGSAGTRVVDSWGQRILTIACVWAVPCGATFAVIPTLAQAFFGAGGFLVFVLIFAVMIFHMWLTAKVFGRFLNPPEERTGLIMELPPYHKPRWGHVCRRTFGRVWEVFKKALIVVFVVSSVFFLMSYQPDASQVNTSALFKIGSAIEPVTRFFGMGWQTFLAFVSSILSKEAVLGVLSAIYTGSGTIFASTVGTAAASSNLSEILPTVIPANEALAFMIAVTFNVPCLMAVTSTYQESHSLRWTLRIAGWYIASALVYSSVVSHVGALFV